MGRPRAVLYARVSTEEQAKSGYSLRQQMEALRAYCESEGLDVAAEIDDPGYSGAYLDRPGLEQVRSLVEAGGVSLVLAQDRDRLSREPAYLYLLREEFLRHGCALRALNDRGDDSPEGQLTDGIMDQLAKFERAKTAERTRRGSLRKVFEGRVLGATPKPRYGFRWTKDDRGKNIGYEVYEPEMATVRRILAMVADGSSLNGVTTQLQADGVPAPKGGRDWGRHTIREMVKNDLYRPHGYGELEEFVAQGRVGSGVMASLDRGGSYGITWHGRVRKRKVSNQKLSVEARPPETWIGVPVALDGSGLDRETVDRARANLADNKSPSKVGDRFWELSGGPLKCADCGRRMIALSRRYESSRQNLYYYRCPERPLGPTYERVCPNRKSHRAEDLETRAWETISSMTYDPEGELFLRLHDQYVRSKKELGAGTGSRRVALADELAKIEAKRDRLYDLAADGLMDKEVLRRKLAAMDDNEKALREELSRSEDTAEQLAELEESYATMVEAFTEGLIEVEGRKTPQGRRAHYKRLGVAFVVDAGGTLEARWALRNGCTDICTDTSTTPCTIRISIRL